MLTNNDILKKLRVALTLKDTDILDIIKLSGFEVTKTELSALFRNPDDDRYVECGDQILRRFLDGLIIKNRGRRDGEAPAAGEPDEAGGQSSRPGKPERKVAGTKSARGEKPQPGRSSEPKRPPRLLEPKIKP